MNADNRNKTLKAGIVAIVTTALLVAGCARKNWEKTHEGVHEVTVYTLLHGGVKIDAMIRVYKAEDGSEKAIVFYPDKSRSAMDVDIAKSYFD